MESTQETYTHPGYMPMRILQPFKLKILEIFLELVAIHSEERSCASKVVNIRRRRGAMGAAAEKGTGFESILGGERWAS